MSVTLVYRRDDGVVRQEVVDLVEVEGPHGKLHMPTIQKTFDLNFVRLNGSVPVVVNDLTLRTFQVNASVEVTSTPRMTGLAGGGQQGTGAGAGEASGAMGPQRRTVPQLEPAPDIHKFCYRFQDLPSSEPDFFLDAGGRLSPAIRQLLEENAIRFRNGLPLRPLVITGPVKAGKSSALNKALPAFAVKFALDNGLREPNFLMISCEGIIRHRDVPACLSSLLGYLVAAARAAGLQRAADTPQPRCINGGDAMTMLQEFMYRLPKDRINYLLLDEVQKLYLLLVPTASVASQRPQLDATANAVMREAMKQLLLNSPPWVAWGITGSGTATLLANIAFTPTNGTALLLEMFHVALPGVVDHELIQVAWGQLQRHYRDKGVELPAELVWCAPQNHAMLAYMCSEWTSRKSNISTAHKLVQSVKIGKLMPEALADLRLLLEMVPETKLLDMLLAMTDSAAGVLKEALPPLLIEPLRAFGTEEKSDPKLPKRLIMDTLYCELLRMMITEDGRLIENPVLEFVVPALDTYKHRQLAVLGERCCGHDELVNELMVLNRKENKQSAAAGNFHNAVTAKEVTEPGVALGWFHRLQRNVLVHGDLSTQRQVSDQYPPSLLAFVEDGRVSSVLTRTFSAKVLPAAVGKKQPPTVSLLAAATRQRVAARCMRMNAGVSSRASVRLH